MNLNDTAARIQAARRTARSSPLGRRAARRLANDTEALLAAVAAILALHRPDEHGTCEICRDGPGEPDIGAPCPTAAVALGIDPPVLQDDEQSRADRRRASLNPDERLCYSDECGEPCRSAQEMARRELHDVRRQLATVDRRLGTARRAADHDGLPAQPTREEVLKALAEADGQVRVGFDLGHTAEMMYGRLADAVIALCPSSDGDRGQRSQ